MEEEKRDTVGKISLDLQQKEPDSRDPIEIQREVHKKYEQHIYDAAQEAKRTFMGDFFIEVATKKERLMHNVLRNFFCARQSCPTPTWDQTVYWYHKDKDMIEFLWVVPSKDTCELFIENALLIDPAEKELLGFVLDFNDGTLLQRAKIINKEIALN